MPKEKLLPEQRVKTSHVSRLSKVVKDVLSIVGSSVGRTTSNVCYGLTLPHLDG